jgi:hypothetical protein
VTVLGRGGALVERISTVGKCPTNLAFGPSGEKKIYVTEAELGQVAGLDTHTEGLALLG